MKSLRFYLIYIIFTNLFLNHALATDVLGIGGPALDVMIPVEESFLSKFNVRKGSVCYIEAAVADAIINEFNSIISTSLGGLNAVRTLAKLGFSTAVIGAIGDDSAGKLFENNITAIHAKSFLKQTVYPTNKIVCLITPEKDRTLLIVSGAARKLDCTDLKPEYFADTKLVHVEGVLIFNPDLLENALQKAKNQNAIVSFQMPKNFSLIEQNRELLIRLLKKYVDIVFGNAEQIRSLFDMDAESGCKQLQTLCKIVAVTDGKNGCYVANNNGVHHIPALKAKPIDTTGAGDLFAAGFLYGYLKNYSLQNCANCGHLLSKAVVEQYGADISQDILLQLKPFLK